MLGVRLSGVGVALAIYLKLAERVRIGVGVLVEYPLFGMADLVGVDGRLSRGCLITGSGGTVARRTGSVLCVAASCASISACAAAASSRACLVNATARHCRHRLP